MGLFSSKPPAQEPVAAQDAPRPVLLAAQKEVQTRYEREVWWLEHRRGLRMALVVLLITAEVLLALVGVWAFADYFLINYVDEQRLIGSFFDGAGTIAQGVATQRPQELEVKRPAVVSAGSTYDVLAYFTNTNPEWVATVAYRLTWQGGETAQKTISVLQGATVPVTAFQLTSRPADPQLVVDSVRWQHINPHLIPDPLAWKQERLNVVTEDVRHQNDVTIGEKTFGRTTFSLVNKTGYGYSEVPLVVVLKRGGTVVGVNQTTVSSLQARETRAIQVDWFDRAPEASEIEVYPLVDLFDASVYLGTNTDPTLDLRDIKLRR